MFKKIFQKLTSKVADEVKENEDLSILEHKINSKESFDEFMSRTARNILTHMDKEDKFLSESFSLADFNIKNIHLEDLKNLISEKLVEKTELKELIIAVDKSYGDFDTINLRVDWLHIKYFLNKSDFELTSGITYILERIEPIKELGGNNLQVNLSDFNEYCEIYFDEEYAKSSLLKIKQSFEKQGFKFEVLKDNELADIPTDINDIYEYILRISW